MEQLRMIDTPSGPLTYVLVRKRVKNINLRVESENKLVVSVPMRCPAERADRFVWEKSDWIVRTLNRLCAERKMPLPAVSMEECVLRLEEALRRVYPLVQPLGIAYPALKIRTLKSQWGNCHWAQGYITLNAALARCPEELRDYVALHELTHFLFHDHGTGFYGMMDQLMPDWKVRRQALKGYASALE